MEPTNSNHGNDARALGYSICERLYQNLGVDLIPIFNAVSLTDKEKISQASKRLIEAIFLDAVDQRITWFTEDETEFDLGEVDDIEPNIALSESDAIYLSGLQGEALKKYLYNLTKRFENMAVSKSPGMLVVEMAAGGIISVGVPLAVNVVKNLRAGQALRLAMLNGVKGLGMKTAIAAVAVILVALLLYLTLENPKKILGMVINNTDDNLIVKNYNTGKGDLYMRHGHMADFMEDNEEGLQSPKVQIRKRMYFEKGSEDNIVLAGIYFADRNFGLRGAEGIMVFSSKESSLKFAHMFAVPYTKDNRTNMKLLKSAPGDLDKLYQELYDANKVRVDFTDGGYKFTSTVNDARGGTVGCIAYIEQS